MSNELKNAIDVVEGVNNDLPRIRTPADCLHCVWGKVLDVDGRWIKVYCLRKGCGYIGRGKRNER